MQAESILVTAPSSIDFGTFVLGMNGPVQSASAGSVTAFANTWGVDVTASSAALTAPGPKTLTEPLQISPGDNWHECISPANVFSYTGNPTVLPFEAQQMISGPDIALGPGALLSFTWSTGSAGAIELIIFR